MPSYSVPTSPAMSRSTSHKSQPVTPQRLPTQRQQHRYSSSQSLYKSPITPASPYTPLSLRSFTSSTSGGSSTLTTPDQIGLSVKRLSFSPEVARTTTGSVAKDQSLADIAENWRSRASENGIKVSSVTDDSHYGDDEASERTLSDTANDSGFISTEEALLAPSFLANQRHLKTMRPRAQSHVPPPTSRPFSSPTVTRNPSARTVLPPTSPLVARRLNQSQNLALTSTPPQNRTLARQLKLKGSFTDPAQTRRREAFGPIRTPSQNFNNSLNFGLNQDTSLDLFDIDENDFEYEYDYSRDQDHEDEDNNSLFELNFQGNNSIGNVNSAYSYPTYGLPLLSPHHTPQQFFPQAQSQGPFADPFQGHALSSIAESVEQHFHAQQQALSLNSNGYSAQGEYTSRQQQIPHLGAPPGLGPVRTRNGGGYAANPAWVPVPAPAPAPSRATGETASRRATTPNAGWQPEKPQGCSVCLAPHPRTLAVLVPCEHPLCSGCLTSALNIVGEKDMECAVCRKKVADFRLVGSAPNPPAEKAEKASVPAVESKEDNGWEGKGSFMDPLFSSPGSGVDALESAFEFGLGLEGARASTPKLRADEGPRGDTSGGGENDNERKIRERGRGRGKAEENVVLRIDNVPWDITPPQIKRWLQQPVERVHVLLDAKGKTMSHAYVEVDDVAVAGRILRGEGGGLDEKPNFGKKKERGSVLGKGRRARGVTVTRSGQEELMADLFPNWRGSFDGSRPSLAGLDGERVIGALEGGLIGESEVTGLLHLIREPDSHFLKVPSLPFHSLISILSKFPADVDSRVFWTTSVRDMLYDVTYAAIQVLRSRINPEKQTSASSIEDSEYHMAIVSELVRTAMDCHAFTAQQISKFTELLESCSLSALIPEDMTSRSGSSARSAISEPKTPENRDMYGRVSTVSSAAVEGEAPSLTSNPGGQALADIAREFGVEAQLVQALAQRLAGLC